MSYLDHKENKAGHYEPIRDIEDNLILDRKGFPIVVKVGKPRIAFSLLWPAHNNPETNGRVFEHLDRKPTYVSTKRQLRYEIESRGLAQKDA